MKLDKTLNFKKVRCVKGYEDCLKIGKEYEVIDISVEIKVKDDEGNFLYWESDHFEPVLDSAENPLQKMELTPQFETEASEPNFEVGDKVYCGVNPNIQTIERFATYNSIKFIGGKGFASAEQCCRATPENYERLQATFPDIEFEQPPKELKGSDLCFKKLREGKVFIVCAISDLSDEKAIKRLQDGDTCIRIIKDCDPAPYHFIDVHGIRHGFAVPLNDETGEPLTESVLDE